MTTSRGTAPPQTDARPDTGEAVIERVSTLELFFDLVFVFTATQLTGLLVHPQGPADYLKVALVFLTLMWMYDGFTWLTSNVETGRTGRRLLLFTAMAGFLTMALAIPDVFGAGGVAYGVGLLVVTAVHAGLFRAAPGRSASAILGVAPLNLAAALVVLGAGFVRPPWDWPLWALAVAVFLGNALLRRERAFTLSPGHFVERHGLVVIVALGESIVAIGVGAEELPITGTLVLSAALALALAASLWWIYFDRDDRRAEHLLERADPARRAHMALYGFGFGHFGMIFGIIMLAAGLKLVIAHPWGHLELEGAFNLAAGLALYLLGDVFHRRVLGIGHGRLRLLAALLAGLTLPLGLLAGGLVQLTVCVGLTVGLLFTEARLSAGGARPTR